MSAARRPGGLSGLDARILPVLAAALRGLGAAGRTVLGSGNPVGRRVNRWVRREPVIVVALLSVVVAGVLIAVTGGDQQSAVRPPRAVTGPVLPDPQRLGPAPGATVKAYLSQAARRAKALQGLGSAQRLEAVVDFSSYLSPLAIDELLAAAPDVDVLRGYARVPPPAHALIHVLITNTKADLVTALAAAQQSAQVIATHYRHEVDRSARHPTTQLQEQLQAGAAQAAQAKVDAKGLGTDCGCVFALVVDGPVGQLEHLAQAAAVRVLDPAPADASLESLMVVPLEPQVTSTIPPVEFAGD